MFLVLNSDKTLTIALAVPRLLLVAGWRKRLGARLLTERVQGKDWNVAEAARASGVTTGTIRRIERGWNYEIANLEKYAECLGRPLEAWLREVLGVVSAADTVAMASDRERLLTQWKALSAQLLTLPASRDLLWSVFTHVSASESSEQQHATK